jgi:DNA-binding transcriptional regulator LsrR (DeoR family)
VDAAFNERVMSVDENIVKRIPLKIGVTSGDYKCDAVIGALNGGWIDTLIIDECLAEKVNQNL